MEVDQSSSLQVETLGTSLATGGLQEQIESGDQSKETADTQQVDPSNDMDEDGQEDDYSSSDSNESMAVDQSGALQVETLGTNLATGGLQEQIESGDQSKETADTQQVYSSVEDEDVEDEDGEEDDD